jgi:hypothetical protein
MKLLGKHVGLIHGVEDMHTHNTVETLSGQAVRLGQVRDDSRIGVRGAEVEYLYLRWPAITVGMDVPGILKLQTTAADLLAILLKELLHIVPVNGLSAFVCEGSTGGTNTPREE